MDQVVKASMSKTEKQLKVLLNTIKTTTAIDDEDIEQVAELHRTTQDMMELCNQLMTIQKTRAPSAIHDLNRTAAAKLWALKEDIKRTPVSDIGMNCIASSMKIYMQWFSNNWYELDIDDKNYPFDRPFKEILLEIKGYDNIRWIAVEFTRWLDSLGQFKI